MKDGFRFGRLLVLAFTAVLAAFPAMATNTPDVTGTWKMTVESSVGTGNPTFILVQKGEEITGNYKGLLGEAPVSGTIKGNQIAISFKVSAQGQELKVDYIGVAEGDTMQGKVVFGEYGEGTFKGAREPQELKPVPLPAPQTSGGRPLMDVLKQRQSTREYAVQKLPPQVLSNLLWAAWGINRPDGRRTAPSASNRQEISIYVVTADGAYRWDAAANVLNPVVLTDIRPLTGRQAWVAEAPLNLVYVADVSKFQQQDENSANATAHADTGFIAQNVYLFCASEGLGTVVRGSVERVELGKVLKLGPGQRIILAQTVGYLKQ